MNLTIDFLKALLCLENEFKTSVKIISLVKIWKGPGVLDRLTALVCRSSAGFKIAIQYPVSAKTVLILQSSVSRTDNSQHSLIGRWEAFPILLWESGR